MTPAIQLWDRWCPSSLQRLLLPHSTTPKEMEGLQLTEVFTRPPFVSLLVFLCQFLVFPVVVVVFVVTFDG